MACPGQIIPFKGLEYRLGEVIGRGFSGIVFECVDNWGNPLVAKVIQPHNQSDIVRWDAESRKLYQMRHPNITFMHSAFQYNGEFFIILERCYCDLTRMKPPFKPEFIYSLARDLLQGLDFIHAHGFIHKDIHAGNIFYYRYYDSLTQQFLNGGHFKIGDLGITKNITTLDTFAPSFAPWMIPPESLDYAFGQVSFATDIYHVGLLLLALVHDRLDLNFSHQDIWEGEPEKYARELNPPYNQVLGTALKRHMHERYQTAFEFWRAIQASKRQMFVESQQINLYDLGILDRLEA